MASSGRRGKKPRTTGRSAGPDGTPSRVLIEDEVRGAYAHYLGRDPESYQVVPNHARGSDSDPAALIAPIGGSPGRLEDFVRRSCAPFARYDQPALHAATQQGEITQRSGRPEGAA
jgi:hypothetical protein